MNRVDGNHVDVFGASCTVAYSKKSKYMYRVQWVSPTERGNLQ